MTPKSSLILLAAGVAVVLGAGAAAYFLAPGAAPTAQTVPALLAMPPEPAPAPLPDAPADDAAAQARQALLDAESVPFSTLIKPFTLLRDSAVYVGATKKAPQMYELKAGASLISASGSRDGKWVIALTVDGQAAYLRTEDLGPYHAPAAPDTAQTPPLAGNATVVDTGTLQVDGQQISLAGIHGLGEPYAQRMQKLIDAQGGRVACTANMAKPVGYVCTLPHGADLARIALFNGIASSTEDASTDYKNQADAANAAHKGFWADGGAPP